MPPLWIPQSQKWPRMHLSTSPAKLAPCPMSVGCPYLAGFCTDYYFWSWILTHLYFPVISSPYRPRLATSAFWAFPSHNLKSSISTTYLSRVRCFIDLIEPTLAHQRFERFLFDQDCQRILESSEYGSSRNPCQNSAVVSIWDQPHSSIARCLSAEMTELSRGWWFLGLRNSSLAGSCFYSVNMNFTYLTIN